ncbi:MAG TPA: ABC transporter permease [Anaerolineales bacterium]
MKSLLKMAWVESKLFLREPVGVFFTLIFPLMMLFIFGTIYSNTPVGPGPGGPQAIGSLIPAFTAMVIGITGMMPITITMATYRENGILGRLRTTPVSPLVVLVAQVVVVFSISCLGVILLGIAGRLVYHVQFQAHPLSLIVGFTFSCLSFFGIGFILAGTMPNARTAQIIAMVLMYPTLILSGAAWPSELMPSAVQKVSAFMPLTYVVNLLRGLWVNESWSQHTTDVIVLAIMLVVGVFISIKLFRWE